MRGYCGGSEYEQYVRIKDGISFEVLMYDIKYMQIHDLLLLTALCTVLAFCIKC